MNATIEKIIGLLFEDLEESEEVRAIHEEVRTNCQERYEDMLSMGMSQDEAIGSVVESLRGMEEMLRPYPRKQIKSPETEVEAFWDGDDAEDKEVHLTSTSVQEIQLMHMGSTDIELVPSSDDLIHIDGEDAMPVKAVVKDGMLIISLKENPRSASTFFEADTSKNDILGILNNLREALRHSFNLSGGGGTLRVALPAEAAPTVRVGTSSGSISAKSLHLPELHLATASGDICLDDLVVQTVKCSSSSGDISLSHLTVDHLQLTSASGDIHAQRVSSAFETRLSTTSGDVRWEGDSPVFAVNTISGDIDHASGIFADLRFKTVSGDVSMDVLGEALTALDGKTTSGDVRLKLPPQQRFCLKCRSVSGDIRNTLLNDPASPVVVGVVTSSGDITIR